MNCSFQYSNQDAIKSFFQHKEYSQYIDKFIKLANEHINKNVEEDDDDDDDDDEEALFEFFDQLIRQEKVKLNNQKDNLGHVTFLEGNIGIGKSTFIKKSSMTVVVEPLKLWQLVDYIDANGVRRPSFEFFYYYLETRDKTNFIFWFEVFAILTRILIFLDQWHSSSSSSDGGLKQLISERSFATDR